MPDGGALLAGGAQTDGAGDIGGDMATVDFPHGTLHHHEAGSGTPIAFLHDCLMGAKLWDPVIQLLEGEFRCPSAGPPSAAWSGMRSASAPRELGRCVGECAPLGRIDPLGDGVSGNGFLIGGQETRFRLAQWTETATSSPASASATTIGFGRR